MEVLNHGFKMDIPNQIKKESIAVQESDNNLKAITDKSAKRIAKDNHLSLGQVFVAALKTDIYPYRYIRNKSTISISEQIKLAESTVAVIGCGGIGGYVILALARLGVGFIVAVDGDIFDETNLNRQMVSNVKNINKSKTDEVKQQVLAVNPAVTIIGHPTRLSSDNAQDILSESQVVVDALDNIRDRLMLQQYAQLAQKPMVHGAISGFEGQIMTILPKDPGLKLIYGELNDNSLHDKTQLSSEKIMGVPAVTPMAVGSFQVMEVIKLLLNRGRLIRNKMMYLDLEYGQLNELSF